MAMCFQLGMVVVVAGSTVSYVACLEAEPVSKCTLRISGLGPERYGHREMKHDGYRQIL